MEKLLQIVFFALPLTIILNSLQIFYSKENTKIKIKKLLIRILGILFLIGLNFQFGEQIGKSDMALIGAVSGTVFLIFLLLVMGFLIIGMKWYNNYKIHRGTRPKIEAVDNFGFTMSVKNRKDFYEWKNVKSIKTKVNFVDNKEIQKIRLTFEFLDGRKKIKVEDNFVNFYYLLRNIPQGYTSMDYEFRENLFGYLKTCPFCGLVSCYNGRCLYCLCSLEFWTEDQKEDYPTVEDYIKEEQLELFATNNKNEKFNEFEMISLAFERDENWKPLVNKQQVLQYSKENFW